MNNVLTGPHHPQYFWGLHPANKLDYGRLYFRVRIAELLKDVCGVPPYGHLDVLYEQRQRGEVAIEILAPPSDEPGSTPPLCRWDRDRWDDLAEDISVISMGLARKDANSIFETSDAPGDEEKVKDRDLAANRLETIGRLIELHKALSPIRLHLETQILNPDIESFFLADEEVQHFV